MKHLTFLNYDFIKSEGKTIAADLSEKDKEIEQLKAQQAKMAKALYEAGILKKD
jgi:uncharacterized protein YydD (DUF2326 family)